MNGSELSYTANGQSFTGYLAMPDVPENSRGNILIVHEWWGRNDYMRRRADMLAELNYTAFAIDMYGSGKLADKPEDALSLMQGAIASEEIPARFQAAMDVISDSDSVPSRKFAAIGYCFGGAVVLGMARAGLPLAGVASFHGALGTDTPAQKGQVEARIKVYHGNDDGMLPAAETEAFKAEMDAADVDYEFVGYDGAGHGFTNPEADAKAAKFGLDLAYNQQADEDSWRRLCEFLDELF
jgi:dienelactone hydrolase